jgi:hypothetical protein
MKKHFRFVLTAAVVALSATAYPAQAQAGPELFVFGGKDHDTFLGCLTCSKFDANSGFNSMGRYGSTMSLTSITNKMGSYGSAMSLYGVCNQMAMHPPVVVDRNGSFYGELTVNQMRWRRFNHEALNAWLQRMCEA